VIILQEYIFNKQINTRITSVFNESGKSFQELMEECFLQTLKSKLFASTVGELVKEKHIYI
jgi:hypothetical protein